MRWKINRSKKIPLFHANHLSLLSEKLRGLKADENNVETNNVTFDLYLRIKFPFIIKLARSPGFA